MKKIGVIIFGILIVVLLVFGIYNLKDNKELEVQENQIVNFIRNIPIENNEFSTTTYEVDFSNNKVKEYKDNNQIDEYVLSTDKIEWIKVIIAHCFENENLNEEILKSQNNEYYVIKVDDTKLFENRRDRVEQATKNLEK